MRSQKIRLALTKEQERLAWWYSKVSRNFWNLLVDIDKRNNKGEFDEILNKNGNKTYGSYKKDLKLGQRVYHCDNCQEKLDRDFNASLNIAKTDKYVLA